jgi:hypothetical protein
MKRLAAAVLLFLFVPQVLAFGQVALIAIIFSPDGSKYVDFVAAYSTEAECQSRRAKVHKAALQHYGKDHFIFSMCAKPKSLGMVEA